MILNFSIQGFTTVAATNKSTRHFQHLPVMSSIMRYHASVAATIPVATQCKIKLLSPPHTMKWTVSVCLGKQRYILWALLQFVAALVLSFPTQSCRFQIFFGGGASTKPKLKACEEGEGKGRGRRQVHWCASSTRQQT